MSAQLHDRSDLHLGLQVAFWNYPEGICKWDPAFISLGLDSIAQITDDAFLEFRKVVPEDTISTKALLAMGAGARRRGVAEIAREIKVVLSNGRSATILPTLNESRFMFENIWRKPQSDTTAFLSQGENSCWLDVTLFLSVCFNLGQQQRDARTLGSLQSSTRTQIAFQYTMAHMFQCKGEIQAQVKHNNQLRNVLLDVMSDENPGIVAGGMNDIGDSSNYCWQGLHSLTYTYIDCYMCCSNLRLLPINNVARRRTSHSIQLVYTPDPPRLEFKSHSKAKKKMKLQEQPSELPLHAGKTLADVVSDRYFYQATPQDTHRSKHGEMKSPFPPCSSACIQLPRKILSVLDDLPNYLVVTVDHGSPITDTQMRQYQQNLRLEHYEERKECITVSSWELHGVGLQLPKIAHFIGRAFDPPGFEKFKGAYCEFDGLNEQPRKIDVPDLLYGLDENARVTLLIYKMTNVVKESNAS